MTDPVPAFDHTRVGALLRIIHDTINLPGMETIRDAATVALAEISKPLVAAKTKAVADAKAKHDALVAEATAKHKDFPPDTAANLTTLKLAIHDAEAAAEKNPTAANIAAHETAVKAYTDALKAAEIAARPPKAMPAPAVQNAPELTTADAARRV